MPSDYINVFRKARINPSPFFVKYVDHTFFTDFRIGPYLSIRPGKKKGDPTVTDICCLRYTPDGNIQYKLSFENDFNDIPKNRNQDKTKAIIPKCLYQGRLKITKNKYQHLQELKSVIIKEHHVFYDQLLHD